MKDYKIILASSSPYRQALLDKLQLNYTAIPPDIDENAQIDEKPSQLAIRLATEKAHALSKQFPNHLIIGSDQVAILGRNQLKKPENRQNTIAQLTAASGRQVSFYTAVCVFNSFTGQYFNDLDICIVTFKHLSKQQIESYVDLDQPFNCAGGFKSEGLGIALFEKIEGEDPNALIGLPLIKLISLLEKFNIQLF